MKLNFAKIIKITIFGTLMACVGDVVHVLTSTTAYRNNEPLYFWTMPYWMPIGYALAVLAMVILQTYYENWASKFTSVRKAMVPSSQVQAYMIAGVGYLLVHCLSGFIQLPAGSIKDIILLLLAVGFWFWVDRSLAGILFAFFAGAMGTLGEIITAHFGYMRYVPPSNNFYGVASWLLWIYFSATVAVGLLRNAPDPESQSN